MGTEGHSRRGLPGWFAIRESASRLSRIGVIDVGSNSVRLVVFDGMARSPAYFYNEKVLCGLGASLRETGRLSPEGWRRALAALHRFVALAGRMELSGLIAVATAAVREATDGPAFCDQVEARDRPAASRRDRLGGGAARGEGRAARLARRRGAGLRHGRRLDGARAGRRRRGRTPAPPRRSGRCSSPTSAIRRSAPRRSARQVKALRKAVPGDVGRLFLVGGSWRAIARLDMERVGYPLKVLHGYEPPVPQLLETLRWIRDKDEAALSAMTGTSEQRLSLVPLARRRAGRAGPPDRAGAGGGLGLRAARGAALPADARGDADARPADRGLPAHGGGRGAQPGFGEALHAWLKPLYPDRTPDRATG